LHKQSVSGDAPATFSTAASAAERAKYQAWRSKSGLSQTEAMRSYLQESDRQLRVYGTSNPQTPETTPTGSSVNANNNNSSNNQAIPRGLAAIPLLCAAAAESRPAFLRRISQTPVGSGWWGRQEALCDGITVLPETLLIHLARMIEYWSLASSKVVAALLWPLHNALLSVWIFLIVVLQLSESSLGILQVLIWGARRTGLDLQALMDHLVVTGESVNAMAAAHQALTCRLVGVALGPLPFSLSILNRLAIPLTVSSAVFLALVTCTWWYWLVVLPWLAACLLGVALSSGTCFALIEFADGI
jgi:hypothetical protein